MKYNSSIDNITSHKWGLNLNQAYIFDWIYTLASWANKTTYSEETYYFASRNLACKELPILTDKPDTIYRYYKQLEDKGLVKYKKINNKDYIKLTEKGKKWNKFEGNNPSKDSEMNPNSDIESTKLGNESENKPKNSEMNPTYNNTNIDNNTNDNSRSTSEKNEIEKEHLVKHLCKNPNLLDDYNVKEEYLKIIIAFYNLFSKYMIGVREKLTPQMAKARLDNAYDAVRLMIESDKYTIDEARMVYHFLEDYQNNDQADFWMQNIQSLPSLRKKMDQVIIKAKAHERKNVPAKKEVYSGPLSNVKRK